MIRTVFAALLAALLLPAAWSQEAAATRRAVELRDAPGDRGKAVASLPAQASVTRLAERQGPWVQVRTEVGATGWVHMFDLGPASAAGGSSAGNALRGVAGGVTNLFGGRPTQAGTTAAGIRGLEAADLARAQPDAAAVTRMEAARQSDADVRGFAGRSGWRPVAVDPLPEPARAPAAPAGNYGQPQSP
jgi:hypothetical protein